ncbi:bacillithiol biosynthesis cysteine-adding enzyme BshC [Brevibacillus sp. SYSU BS000544]|uniref:bacillithiol biosynthesis cysteine-adding enzyme BshC n=1 Tax=Brevibacillus sp. SYSU BS000544 TaxID=3416443 RepID=UPI003CE58120
MNIVSILLSQSNELIKDYIEGKESANQFFAYAPYELSSYRQRLEWLNRQPFTHRQQLVDGLLAYNRQVGNHPVALDQIEKLRKDDVYVVVGGQQAGVLTGPLYSIHKAISLIHSARYLQQQLGVEVIPVFWIAGEDHDYDEINHVYSLSTGGELHKIKLDIKRPGKQSASHLSVDSEQMIRLVDQFFDRQLDTMETQSLKRMLKDSASQSNNLVDWFGRIMAELFGKHGLILVESSLEFVRQLEKPVFTRMIAQAEDIHSYLSEASLQLKQNGYSEQLQLDDDQAHLFIYKDGERHLLYHQGDEFYTKYREVVLTRQELLERIERCPADFSANVVSRPLAQEHIFPTLAFVGGPGEIAYWAYFKNYFAEMGYQLPVVLPRTSITLVEGSIHRCMEQVGLEIATVLSDFSVWKEQHMEGLLEAELKVLFEETREKMLALYRPLVEQVSEMDKGLQALANKNLKRIENELLFLEKKSKESQWQKHEVYLQRIDRIEKALRPEGNLQERVHNIFAYLNVHGCELIDRMVAVDYPFDPSHKVIST